jgi:leader peptidase (prepilin peptidase)/N-methyltransferase
MIFLIYLLVGILGLIIGSFLNVVVLRLHTKKISKGRSKCATCAHTLNTFDLIPVFSFVFLLGRCRYCKSKISFQYPLVEFITAITFITILYRCLIISGGLLTSTILYFIYFAIIFSLLIALCVYDLRHYILPWQLMKPFLFISFLGSIFLAFLNNNLSLTIFITGFVVALPFYLIWFFSKGRLIGFGDIMLMCGIGFILGIASGFLAIMFSFWIGVILILLKVVFERKFLKRDTQIPFGPFLVMGLYIVFVFNVTFYKLMLLII